MRERLERCVLLPFSLGCISESSVLVRRPDCHSKRSPSSSHPQYSPYHITGIKEGREKDDEEEEEDEDGQPLPRFQRLLKNFKNFSHLLSFDEAVYKEDDAEEIGDEEIPIMDGGGGMEIGFPTDVKHVTHIGLDGGAATSILSPPNWRQQNAADVDLFSRQNVLSSGNPSPHPTPAVAMVAAHGGAAP